MVELRGDLARRIIDHGDEHQRLTAAFEPVVDRCVHLHQLTKATATRSPTAVRVASSLGFPQPFSQQPSPQRFDANVQLLLGEFLARQSGTEIRIPRPIGFEDLLAKGGLVLVVGRLASQTVDECGIAIRFQFALDASDLTDASLEQSRSFDLCPFAVEDWLHHFEDITLTLTHLHTIRVLYLDHPASPSA
jgi:hypothetical protein